jgi:hypothetical protein
VSTEYGFQCRSHTPRLSSGHSLREYEARYLFDHRSLVPFISELAGALPSVSLGSPISEAIGWLEDHPHCDVRVEDEYGRTDDDKP